MKKMLHLFVVMALVITTGQAQIYMKTGADESWPLFKVLPTPEQALNTATPCYPPAGHDLLPKIPVTDLPPGTYEVGNDQPVLKKLTDVAAQLKAGIVQGNIIYELNATSMPGTSNKKSMIGILPGMEIECNNPNSIQGNTITNLNIETCSITSRKRRSIFRHLNKDLASFRDAACDADEGEMVS